MPAHTVTFDHDTKLRARDYVDRLQQESLARSASGSHLEVLGYWRSRSGMYRHLAAVVVTAVKKRMSDGERWSLERFRQDILNRTADAAKRSEFQRWFDHRKDMLRSITHKLWQLAKEQEPPLTGLWLALEARPNPDFGSGTHQGSISIPLEWHSVASLADGQQRTLDFIKSLRLGGGNFVGKAGQIALNGEPWVHISYNGRIWNGWEFDSKQELDVNGNPLPQSSGDASMGVDAQNIPKTDPASSSFKFEVLVGGSWSSNAQRYETTEQAQAAGESLFQRWTAVEKFRVVPSDEPPNQSIEAPTRTAESQSLPAPVPMPQNPVVTSRTEETVLRYSIQVKGRWGRMRTESLDHWDLAKRVDPKEPWPMDRLLLMMRNKLAELKVKPGARVRIIEQPWDISSDGIERTSLLSARTLHEEIV